VVTISLDQYLWVSGRDCRQAIRKQSAGNGNEIVVACDTDCTEGIHRCVNFAILHGGDWLILLDVLR
jgi:hypothetical protein